MNPKRSKLKTLKLMECMDCEPMEPLKRYERFRNPKTGATFYVGRKGGLRIGSTFRKSSTLEHLLPSLYARYSVEERLKEDSP